MTHRIPLLGLGLLLSLALFSQNNVNFIGQVIADSSFQGAIVEVNFEGRNVRQVPIYQDGRFEIPIPEDTHAELTIRSETHLKESIIIDTHHAFCDPVTTPLNKRFKMSFALFPSTIAGDIAFTKPYGTIHFVEGTGRRIFEHNMIEVEPSLIGDFADNLDDE